MQVLIYHGYSKQGTVAHLKFIQPLVEPLTLSIMMIIISTATMMMILMVDDADDVHTICLMGDFFTMPASIIKFLIFMSRRNRYK